MIFIIPLLVFGAMALIKLLVIPLTKLLVVKLLIVPLMKLLVIPFLKFLGFSAVGPVAGSLAALYQAYVGNVAAGSLFAIAQAAVMGA